MNNKIQKLILCFIPSNSCNLRCEYCIVSQTHEWERNDIEFKYPVEHIVRCLNKTRLKGVCLVNLTAQGETLLYKDIVPLVKGFLNEGHYIELVTNGLISKKLDKILSLDTKMLSRLEFKISYHYEQLKKLNLEEHFWKNVKKIKDSPCSFTVEIMPNDTNVKCISDICKSCEDHIGALCHATVGRDDRRGGKSLLTDMSPAAYRKAWSILNSEMFEFKMDLLGVRRKEFCYAGAWSLLIDISSGEASQCYGRMNTQNIFDNPYKPIKFVPVGYSCIQPYCFNGHAHLSLGLIPEMNSPTYYQVRNRCDKFGQNWIKDQCKDFFSQKLADNNQEYSKNRKIIHSIVNPFYLGLNMFHDAHSTIRKIKKCYKILKGKF